jgi:hypothetical protein
MYFLKPPVNVCLRVPTQLIYALLLYYYKKVGEALSTLRSDFPPM